MQQVSLDASPLTNQSLDSDQLDGFPPHTWLAFLILAGILACLSALSRLPAGEAVGSLATALPVWALNFAAAACALTSVMCAPEGRTALSELAIGAMKISIVGGVIGHFLLRPAGLALGL